MRSTLVDAEDTTRLVEWCHETVGLTYAEVADAIGVSERTLHRWRASEAAPARTARDRLDQLEELRFWLDKVFERDVDDATEWLQKRLVDLHGKSPQHLVRDGKFERVTEMLATFHTGAFM